MHFLYIFAAVLPAILILLYAYKQDFFPEPPKIVFKTFLFGCATVLAVDLFIWAKTIAILYATPSHAPWHAMPHHVVRCSKRSSNQSLYGLRCVRPDLITV